MEFIFLVFIISLVLVLWSGRTLPRALGGIAEILRLSQFITAFLLVALATSVPEIFIGISSAIQGIAPFSLGNVLGANLANLSLVVGLSVVLAGAIKGDGKISTQNFWFIFLIALLPVLLASDGVLSRGDGLVLLIVFAMYLTKIFRDKEYFSKELAKHNHQGLRSRWHIFRHLSRFLWGTAILLVSAFALIWSAREIVDAYFASQYLLFGAVFLGLGTTLPELVFATAAIRSGQAQAMLGNALGSIAFNAAAVVGLVALVRPIVIEGVENFLIISAALFVAFVLFHFFVYTRNRISRPEAFVLLLVYLVFVGVSLLT